jgi:hypothetical protein
LELAEEAPHPPNRLDPPQHAMMPGLIELTNDPCRLAGTLSSRPLKNRPDGKWQMGDGKNAQVFSIFH